MAAAEISTIVNYFRALNVTTLSLLMCFSEDLKTSTLRHFSDEGFQVSFGQMTSSEGSVLDLNCYNNETVKKMEGEWLVFGTKEEVATLPVLPDTRVTLYDKEESLLDVYKPSMSAQLKVAKFKGRRDHSNLGGITLKAVSLKDKLITEDPEVTDDIFGNYGCLSKQPGGWTPTMSKVLVDNLAQQLNFKVKRKKVPDCKTLYRTLAAGGVDFGDTAIMMIPERMEHSVFTGEIYEHKSMILYKQPGLSVMRNIYLLPFHRHVWLCCLALFLFCFFLLLLAALTVPESFEEYNSSVLELLTLLIGLVSQQGLDLFARSFSTRLCVLLFSICSLFLYTSYSANIVALLQSSAKTVTSIVELTASPLMLAVQDRPYNKIYLQESDEEVKELYETKLGRGLKYFQSSNNKPFMTAEEGVNKIKSQLFAFQVETSLAYQLISKTYTAKEKCGLSELHVYTFPRYSIPVARSSGYRELFISRLSRQRECGLINQVERRKLNPKPACTASDSGFVSVTFDDFFPGLLVLLWGLAAAVAALLGEVVTVRCSVATQFERKRKEK